VLLFRCLPFANFSWVSSCLGLDFLFAGFPAMQDKRISNQPFRKMKRRKDLGGRSLMEYKKET